VIGGNSADRVEVAPGMIIRDPSPRDEARWRQLWAGYLAFYEADVSEEVTNRTWQRILDPASPLFARLAEEAATVVGFSISVLHLGTWTVDPICYLEDLFVDPRGRRMGTGRRLVQDLIDLARERGWSRLYWHTRASNPARRLYDQFVEADGFIRYRLMLTE
jgi:GNAT superfamily N-acetyltransferase